MSITARRRQQTIDRICRVFFQRLTDGWRAHRAAQAEAEAKATRKPRQRKAG